MSELRRCRATTSLREQSEGGGEVFLGVGSGGDQSKQPVIAFRSPDVLGGLSGPRHAVLGSSTEQRCEQIDTVNKLATGFAFCLLPPPPHKHTQSLHPHPTSRVQISRNGQTNGIYSSSNSLCWNTCAVMDGVAYTEDDTVQVSHLAQLKFWQRALTIIHEREPKKTALHPDKKLTL